MEPSQHDPRPPASVSGDRAARIAIGLGLFAALTWARTAGISDNFWLLGEQIRDWSIALAPWTELPLSGTPSTLGGRSLGPIYYWVLWIIRVTLGPLFDYLPHAGGVGLSMIQAGADVVLFFALWRHSASAAVSLAVVLLAATAPYDMALSATIWNPPLSVAFVKIAIALFLTSATHASAWRMAATVGVAWLAVQAHSSAIFVFAPIASWFVIRELGARRWRAAAQTARLILEILLILQIPFLVDRLTSPSQGTPAMAAEALTRVAARPASAAPHVAFSAISDAIRYIWVNRAPFESLGPILLAAALACLWAARRRPWILAVTAAPLALAVAAFSGWTRPFENYWFLTLSPPLALMVGEALMTLPRWRVREAAALVFLGLVLSQQPTRLIAVTQIHKLPEYGALVEGAREVARRTPEVRNIFTEFEVPATTDPTFLFRCLGGRVTTGADYNAFISRDGGAYFRSTKE